ncbi:MAG: hypothetical protein ACRCTD_14465 [Beijerinckiaceae bacterium]
MFHPDLVSTAPSQRRITSHDEARAFVREMLDSIAEIETVIALETDLMKAGRVRDALALHGEKSQKSGHYLRHMQTLKANAIVVARFVPGELEALKKAHAGFTGLLTLNQQVIATVKSVSENLVRNVQQETTATRALSTYGPGAHVARHTPGHAPLALSVQL